MIELIKQYWQQYLCGTLAHPTGLVDHALADRRFAGTGICSGRATRGGQGFA